MELVTVYAIFYIIYLFIVFHRKEIALITVVVSVFLHLVCVGVFYRNAKPTLPILCPGSTSTGIEPLEEEIVYGEEVKAAEIVAVPKPVEFESR